MPLVLILVRLLKPRMFRLLLLHPELLVTRLETGIRQMPLRMVIITTTFLLRTAPGAEFPVTAGLTSTGMVLPLNAVTR